MEDEAVIFSKAKMFFSDSNLAARRKPSKQKSVTKQARACRQRMRTWSFPAGMVDENAMCVRT